MSIHSRKFQEYVAKQDAFSSLEPIVFGGLLGINYSWGIGIVPPHFTFHYNYVTMGSMASQITSLTVVYSTFYSGADERKHQSSASLAFVSGIHRGPVNSPHKWPVTRKMFSFDVVIIFIVLIIHTYLSLYTHTHTHTHIYICIYIGVQNCFVTASLEMYFRCILLHTESWTVFANSWWPYYILRLYSKQFISNNLVLFVN